MSPGSFRTFSTDTNDFWCCVGTGMENHARYGQLIYAHTSDKLMVNLYMPSTVNWEDQHVSLTQITNFPSDPHTQLRITASEPRKFTLSIRHPSWIPDFEMHIKVNQQPVAETAKADQYIDINRDWKDGDTVDIDLPLSLHTKMLPHSNSYVSILYGPIVLAGELGRSGLLDSDFSGQMMSEKKVEPAKDIPAIVAPLSDIANRLEPVVGQPLNFRSHDLLKPADVTLAPLYQIYDQRYAVYWRISSTKGWQADQEKWAAADAHERQLSSATIDHVRPGEQQPEVDHHFKGEKTSNGTLNDRNWRDARDGGWFAYEMKVDPQKENQLMCTFWGSDQGARIFDIMIDGKTIASETLNDKKPGEFVEVFYKIPIEFTRDKAKIEVKFAAHSQSMAGGIFDCRTLAY